MPLNVLVIGAGVSGLTFAILMQKARPDTKITILESHHELCTTGQQIEFKHQGVEIIQALGLLDSIKAFRMHETGIEVLDPKGKPVATFGAQPAGYEETVSAKEYEFMRGDLIKLLHTKSIEQNQELREKHEDAGDLTYYFGKSIQALTKIDNGMAATFTDGSEATFDLIVGADGQNSTTRRLAFGQELSESAFHTTGIHFTCFSLPKADEDVTNAKVFLTLGRRLLYSKPSNRGSTQYVLFKVGDAALMQSAIHGSIQDQRDAAAKTFKDVGWQNERIMEGLHTAKDFYAQEIGQIKLKHLHTGRVGLLGDAGYSPTPLSGNATTGAIIGAYVLAGQLARHRVDVSGALEAYDRVMHQCLDEIQTLPTGKVGNFFPSSRFALWSIRTAARMLSKLEWLFGRFRSEQDSKRWQLPVYPELNLWPATALVVSRRKPTIPRNMFFS